ncbi:unnamed protein product [Phaedon cochleariae]|uniref:Deoxyribonuclease TATDN1 n=1 Tax=Phaedon cochleariae TaxID=80249 RepID=A0A9P0DQQ9_PHACE|nr:unnamed protein product [Phaedon cochleariae]
MATFRKFIDIGANLTDAMYTGVYNGSMKHESDIQEVLKRSWDAGLCKIILTGGNVQESKKALELAQNEDRLYCTVGCHPTRCGEFEENGESPAGYLEQLKNLISVGKNKVVALGECGLDYDRLKFCSKDVQKRYFELQLTMCETVNLPLFLHCRNAADDLYEILVKYPKLRGVVHSFDGSVVEAKRFIDLGLFIGLNGCSLKTKDNLRTVETLPSDRIILETDCPWCEIKPSHAGYCFISEENRSIPSVKKEKWTPNNMVKGRNEPNNIRQVLDIVAGVRNEDTSILCEKIYQNTLSLFFPNEK